MYEVDQGRIMTVQSEMTRIVVNCKIGGKHQG